MKVSGLDIYRTAELMRGEHGDEVHMEALSNAAKFETKNMPEAVQTWKLVASAVLELGRVTCETELN